MSVSDQKEALKNKFENGDFSPSDLPVFFDVFSNLGNELKDIQDEVNEWNCVITLDLTGAGTFWIQIQDGQFSNGSGDNQDTNLHLTMDAGAAAQIFVGEKDAEAALNAGEIKIAGDLPDAMRFYEILELVLEEIEY